MYKVIWEIDIDAKNAIEAAKIAREIQRDPDSMAQVFYVCTKDTSLKNYVTIDLQKIF